jgi:hypothetical protein
MTDDDVLAWIIVMAILGLACVVVGGWQWLGNRQQRREIMRKFWRR